MLLLGDITITRSLYILGKPLHQRNLLMIFLRCPWMKKTHYSTPQGIQHPPSCSPDASHTAGNFVLLFLPEILAVCLHFIYRCEPLSYGFFGLAAHAALGVSFQSFRAGFYFIYLFNFNKIFFPLYLWDSKWDEKVGVRDWGEWDHILF